VSAPQAPVLAVVGPSASGKSALALQLAEALKGRVVNADALQLYRELPLLTAQPDAGSKARAPHRLYGIRTAEEPASAGLWCTLAAAEIAAARSAGQQPILAGGSGLYLKALSRGLAPVPPLPPAVREASDALLAREGPEALHARLAREDPETAQRIAPGDRQRIARAWSVLRATGRCLTAWQRQGSPGTPLRWLLLLPDRDWLRAQVARRFEAMLEAGALEEVRALAARGPDPALPALKAIGYRELTAVLAGGLSLDRAREQAIAATRRYVKRQTTWLRHQVIAAEQDVTVWHRHYSCDLGSKIVAYLRETP